MNAPQGWSRHILYFVSFFIPVVGLILGIIYLVKDGRDCTVFGIQSLIAGLLGIFFFKQSVISVFSLAGIFYKTF